MPRHHLTDDQHPGSFEQLIDDARRVEQLCADCGMQLHPEHEHLPHPKLQEPVIDDRAVRLTDGISPYGD
jgi:hypothetical protein